MDFFEITWPKISHDMVDRINDDFQLLKSALWFVLGISIEETEEFEDFLYKAQSTLNEVTHSGWGECFCEDGKQFFSIRSLALDGGGVLGVFEAEIIEDIEQRTGKKYISYIGGALPVCQQVHLWH